MERFENNSINFQRFYQFLHEEKFTDTYLIAGDNKNIIKCHKLILIASSQYFEDLLNVLDCQNISCTTIALRDISHGILRKILEYFYCGKVDIKADQILEFKRAASYLKINLSFVDETPQVRRNYEDELDISLATQMSQDTAVDEIINDFSMNSSISTIFEGEESDSDEMSSLRRTHSVSLAKKKNLDVEPKLKKAKIDTFKPERCKFCNRFINENNPAYHHQRHCFQNVARTPLKCQKCHEDFEFVISLREHNEKAHRER